MMNSWSRSSRSKTIYVNRYINQPTSASNEHTVIPIGRGFSINQSASNDATFITCIEILATKMAQIKWGVYGADNKKVGYLTSIFNKALNFQPYYGINAFDFWHFMETQRRVRGNAYAYICGNESGLDLTLVPLDAAYMTVYWDDANILDGKRKLWYQYTLSDRNRGTSRSVLIPSDSIIHLKANSTNGLLGRPSGEILADALGGNAEVGGAMRSTIKNGFAGTIILNYTADLSQAKRKELADQIKELMNGVDHTIIPLPAGVNATNIANDVKAYHESLKNANIEDISSFFGIPLAMLNKGSGSGMATFSTNQMVQFYNNAIAPIVNQYANELTVKLLTAKQIGRGFKFDTTADGFDTLDAESKSKVLCAYVNAGILKRNEARTSLMYEQLDDEVAEALTCNGVGGSLGDNAGKDGGGANNTDDVKEE